MNSRIDAPAMAALLREAAEGLAAHRDELTKLDALIGDGDMGVTAELVNRTIKRCTTPCSETDIGRLLMTCGSEINKGSPSTFGTLLASSFAEAGKATLGRREIDVSELEVMGRAAIDNIRKRGRSDAGEKTLLDSLVPAVSSYEESLTRRLENRAAIEAAMAAAKDGAEKTATLKAVHGRAAYRQDRGVGVQDPGAMAVASMIESFGKALIRYLDADPASKN